MSNVQRDGKACVKFSKGIFCVLITLMKLLNTSSDFSVYVAGIFMPLCLGALTFLEHQKTLPLEMGLRALWPKDCTLVLQKPFWYRYGETLCASSCACRKGKGSKASVPQALAHLWLIPCRRKTRRCDSGHTGRLWHCTVGLFILSCTSLWFWSSCPRRGSTFTSSSCYSSSAWVCFVVMQDWIKWITTDLVIYL